MCKTSEGRNVCFYGSRACINCEGLKKKKSPAATVLRKAAGDPSISSSSTSRCKGHIHPQTTISLYFTDFMIFSCKAKGGKGEGEEREAVLWVAKRWHTMYGGERAVMSVAAAVVSVFNLEPGERLCFLCWDSSASRIQEEEGGSRSKVDERVSCLCSCCSTSYPVAAFCTKMRPRIYSCDILSKSPPSHFVCRTCGVTVQSENAARNNGYSDDLCFLTSPRENKCPN